MNNNKALVVLSGGQDSATCLAWALEKFDEVEAITFNYGQKHFKKESKCAEKLAKKAKIKCPLLYISSIKELGGNALVDDSIEVKETDGAPTTFVPGRNLIFLTLACAYAYQRDIKHIITGVSQTDYSNYPDCRDNTIKTINEACNLGMDSKFEIHTPLMWLTKADTVILMKKLGKLDWYKHTWTCYEGREKACRKCPACKLRLRGFKEAGEKDPIKYENGAKK